MARLVNKINAVGKKVFVTSSFFYWP